MCDCIQRVNKDLEQFNTEVAFMFWLDGTKESRALIETQKANRKIRGSAKREVAVFCPWCGKKYDLQKPSTVRKTYTCPRCGCRCTSELDASGHTTCPACENDVVIA